jgi:hypothetical protein
VSILAAEALEQHLELARLVVLVLDEPEIRCGSNKNSTVSDFNASAEIERSQSCLLSLLGYGEILAFREHRSLVANARALRVFEDDDAVARSVLPSAFGIVEALDDPDSSFLVDREGDGIHHERLGREELYLKLIRHLHPGNRFLRLEIRLTGRLPVIETVFLLGKY